jgi:hypothetical protein
MTVNSNQKTYITVCGIAIVLFSVAMFLLWLDRSKLFWTTYIFTVIAILGVGFNACYIKSENQHFAANITLFTISVVYLIVSALWSIAAMALLQLNGIVYIVIHIMALGLFLIVWLLARLSVRYINSQDK